MNLKREVKRFLEKNKVDYRSQQFEVDVLRENVHAKEEVRKQLRL